MRSPQTKRSRPSHCGGILVSVLIFVVISSFFLLAMSSMVWSYYGRSTVESNYAAALDLAEAGVNYEMNVITVNSANADQPGSTAPYGNLYSFGNGTFRVYVTSRSGGAWTAGSTLYIHSTGTVNGVYRSIQVAAMPYGGSSSATYGLFGVGGGIVNGNATVNGSVGADSGSLILNGDVTINGTVGYTSSVSYTQNSGVHVTTVNKNMAAVTFPTVETLALQQFPAATYPPGGLAYLATHNDNSLCTATASSTTVLYNGSTALTFNSKAGGANYYVTSLTMNGSSNIYFNNNLGPITIWVGPSGSSSTFIFNGATSAVSMSTNPANAVRVYLATTNDVIQNGTNDFQAEIYNVNNSKSGTVIVNGNTTLNTSIISNQFTINGNATVNAQSGYFPSSAPAYYQFDLSGAYTELNPVD